MRHAHFKNSKPRVKGKKPSNFDPLLQDIRSKLGSNWTFYQECLNEIVQAAIRHQDAKAWLEQMQQLLEREKDISCSHEGVLFLLSETGIVLPGQQCVGEEKVSARTTTVPPSNFLPTPYTTSIGDTALLSLSLVVLTPSPPFTAAPDFKMRNQPDTAIPGRMKTTPFDSNPLRSPSSTASSRRNSHRFAVRDMTHIKTPNRAKLDNRGDPIFFTDYNFQRDVEEFFGVTGRKHIKQPTNPLTFSRHDEPRLVPPYLADEDDLRGWKKRVEKGYKVEASLDTGMNVVLTDGKEELDSLRYWLLEDIASEV